MSAKAEKLATDAELQAVGEMLAAARKWKLICQLAGGKGVDPYELPCYIREAEDMYAREKAGAYDGNL